MRLNDADRTNGLLPGLVSVALPVRNGMPYLPLAVESLLAQTYRSIEIIVVDDGSDDETPNYLDSLSDTRVRVVHAERRGVAAAMNRGLSEAWGEFYARQDADDLSFPDRIDRQVAHLRQHGDVDVVATSLVFVDADGDETETPWTREVRRLHEPAVTPEQIRRLLPLTCCIAHGSILARTSVILGAGGYNTDYEWTEDYDLWLRLLPQSRFARLRERLYALRLHGGRVSVERRTEQLRKTIRAKLEFLRRIAPSLPQPARTLVRGDGIGATMYRELAPRFDLDLVTPDASDGDLGLSATNPDLVIETDVMRLDDISGQIMSRSGWVQEGNFFIRRS